MGRPVQYRMPAQRHRICHATRRRGGFYDNLKSSLTIEPTPYGKPKAVQSDDLYFIS